MYPIKSSERRLMMDVSEEALWDAAIDGPNPERRIAHELVLDDQKYRQWRPQHERLVIRVVSARRVDERHANLRRQAAAVQHHRSLIDYIRVSGLKGKDREHLFSQFFPHLDYETAVLKEHRRYTFTVSTGISLDQLMRLHQDTDGIRMVSTYRSAYYIYFDLYCRWLAMADGAYKEVVRLAMMEARRDADSLRHKLHGSRIRRNGSRV